MGSSLNTNSRPAIPKKANDSRMRHKPPRTAPPSGRESLDALEPIFLARRLGPPHTKGTSLSQPALSWDQHSPRGGWRLFSQHVRHAYLSVVGLIRPLTLLANQLRQKKLEHVQSAMSSAVGSTNARQSLGADGIVELDGTLVLRDRNLLTLDFFTKGRYEASSFRFTVCLGILRTRSAPECEALTITKTVLC